MLIDAESAEYLHRTACSPGATFTPPSPWQTSYQLRGSDFSNRALRSALGSAPGVTAHGSSLGLDCRASDRESMDQEALAGLVRSELNGERDGFGSQAAT